MNRAENLLEPTIFFKYTKSPYQNYEWDLLKLSSTCISFADSSKAVQILLIIFLIYKIMFLCCLHLEIYIVKNLPIPCTVVVCAGEGAQSRRCSSSIEWIRYCRSWNIRGHSRGFAMMRLRSYLWAPNRI